MISAPKKIKQTNGMPNEVYVIYIEGDDDEDEDYIKTSLTLEDVLPKVDKQKVGRYILAETFTAEKKIEISDRQQLILGK